jgi:hypothetical protein
MAGGANTEELDWATLDSAGVRSEVRLLSLSLTLSHRPISEQGPVNNAVTLVGGSEDHSCCDGHTEEEVQARGRNSLCALCRLHADEESMAELGCQIYLFLHHFCNHIKVRPGNYEE